MSGQPWLKFYPADWRQDPALRMCSLAARGLWIEMLCLMWQADPCGSLLVNGKQVTPRQLAPLVGTSPKDAEVLVDELAEAGVFSRDEDGAIYSRRMRKDVDKANRDKANGKGGGNPRLKGDDNPRLKAGVNPPNNPSANGGVKAQKPEARSQRPEAAPQPPRAVDPERPSAKLDRILAACSGALGDHAPVDPVIGPIALLIERGAKLDEVLTILRSETQRPRQKPIRTWKLWAEKVAEQLASAPVVAIKPLRPEDPADPLVHLTDEVAWPESLVRKVADRFDLYPDSWPDGVGPAPGCPGCRVPEHLLPERLRQPEESRH